MDSNQFKALTILFVPNDGFENMKSMEALAEELRERGHQTIFALNTVPNGLNTSLNDSENFGQILAQNSSNYEMDFEFDVFQLSAIEVFEKFSLKCLWKKLAQNMKRDVYYEKLIQRIKPDIIIVESRLTSPALINSAIPWVWLNFGPPNQFIRDKRLPPAWSGMSNKNYKKWSYFNQKKNLLMTEFTQQFNSWCLLRGVTDLPNSSLKTSSPYLNIYVYPREIDFDFGKAYPPKCWHRVNSLIKSDKNIPELEIPPQLMSKPGHLIYLEMGAYGTADINLMKRLTALLSNSPNKFIVSKGPFFDQYQLPHNMWGLESLPQTQAIRAADLVINCGDTNLITESLFYGKPQIVMPLFGEQLDSAQRVKECGLGVILEPYKCRLSTIFGSIYAMLSDPLVHRRLSNISYKMQNSDEIKTVCGLIEGIQNTK